MSEDDQTPGDQPSGGQAPPQTLAEKLDRLFEVVRPAGRRGYSFEEVAAAIRERGGPTISASYIWQLRQGIKDNPTKRHLEALADFFGVPASYFFDDEAAERIDAQLQLLGAMRDASVYEIALRARGLSPEVLKSIRGIIEHARTLEGLPPDSPADPDEQAQSLS